MVIKLFVVVVTAACLCDICLTKTTLYCKRQARTGFIVGSYEGHTTKMPIVTRPPRDVRRNVNDHCCSDRPMPSETYTCCVGEKVFKETHRCCPWDSERKKLHTNGCACDISFAELQKHYENVNSTLTESKQLLKDLAEKESNVATGYVKYYGDISQALDKILRKLGLTTLEKAFKVIKCTASDEKLTQSLIDVILTTTNRRKLIQGMEDAAPACWEKIEDEMPAVNTWGVRRDNDDSDTRQEIEEYKNEVTNMQKPHLLAQYEMTCILAPLRNEIRSFEWLLITIEEFIQEAEESALQDETEELNSRSMNSASTVGAGCVQDHVNKAVSDMRTYYDRGRLVLNEKNEDDTCALYWSIDPRPASIRPTDSTDYTDYY